MEDFFPLAFLRRQKCLSKSPTLCLEKGNVDGSAYILSQGRNTVQIMKLLFIACIRVDFSTGRTQAVGLHIPHVSKYILCDLACPKASWALKHKQMVLAGVTPQPICERFLWKLPLGEGMCTLTRVSMIICLVCLDCPVFCCTSIPSGLAFVTLKNVPV